MVACSWDRFADQPALLHADLTAQEREALQARAEKPHPSWKQDRDYLAPPAFGELAELAPALMGTPPPGFAIGYVPVVTRQEAKWSPLHASLSRASESLVTDLLP